MFKDLDAFLKPGFHSNARKALRKEKYASKIKSAQETQENYASKKQKYTSASHETDASGLCARNAMIESILFLTQRCVRLNGNRALVRVCWVLWAQAARNTFMFYGTVHYIQPYYY